MAALSVKLGAVSLVVLKMVLGLSLFLFFMVSRVMTFMVYSLQGFRSVSSADVLVISASTVFCCIIW